MKHLILPVAVILLFSCKPLRPATYYTGLYTLHVYDSTRKFDKNFRPVKIDLFFPAAKTISKYPLSYEEILDMAALRLNYSLPKDSCHITTHHIAQAIAQEFKLDSANSIFYYNTEVYTAELPAKTTRKLPVIIYAASMNGSSWENIILFHRLVQQGYLVAAISSVGRYPGDMGATADLEEQVKDLLFTQRYLSALSMADTAHIGLLGWGLGGSAITKAAMQSSASKCLLSLDGTEIHWYGNEAEWDRECNKMMRGPQVYPQQIRVPYCYLGSEHPDMQQHSATTSHYYLKLNNARHEDFSSLISIAEHVQPSLGSSHSKRQQLVGYLAGAFFDTYLKQQPTGFDKIIDSLLTGYPAEYSKAY
ncbi:hypothetical protein ACDQ55_20075 [Chitinophaga sp. 30R24]|uniref:hypothetical protein n=1 Tax=Chitinophaga sp. 30R24 TaxID=3248838 RepID=UPI003B917D03